MDSDSSPKFLVNPVIVEESGVLKAEYESCISIPHYSALVRRSTRIKVKALDARKEQVELEAGGLLARVLQHEIDHLNGILLSDRMESKSLRHDDYIDQYELPTKP